MLPLVLPFQSQEKLPTMKLFRRGQSWFLWKEERIQPLNNFSLDEWLGSPDGLDSIERLWTGGEAGSANPHDLPMENQEVWAAGVTYLRSKTARMQESEAGASAYDRVYEAARPELFFKADRRRCVGPDKALELRADSKWMVPEPELTLVISAHRRIVGYTLGNDLSCRDIEGENSLYLPQAKIWDRCCALGPVILLSDGVDIRSATISLEIERAGQTVFSGSTPIARIKRPFEELVEYLFRHQTFSRGVFLLTGTGIVPPDDFTLRPADRIIIQIPQIGRLVNTME
jgi:2-dehydro-3-deoxy-D-arabinonate dehydratase